MNNVGETELFTSSNIGYIHFAWELDSYFLLGDLPKIGICISSDAVLAHNTGDSDIVFHNGKDFGIAKLVARDLCLAKRFSIGRGDIYRRPDTSLLKDLTQ